jgi:RimJ/RimL family protein N-acetyltransferase
MDETQRPQTLTQIRQAKEKPAARASWLPVFQFGRRLAWLEPVTRADLGQPQAHALLGGWRARMPDGGGPAAATADWLKGEILEAADRLLFWVKGLDGTPVGTLGLGDFDFAARRVEIRNMVRGVPELLPGVMYCAVQALAGWAFRTFGVEEIRVRVSPDNVRAVRLCERSGFRRAALNPGPTLTMALSRGEWMAAHRLDKVA